MMQKPIVTQGFMLMRYLKAIVLSSAATLPVVMLALYLSGVNFNVSDWFGYAVAAFLFGLGGVILIGLPVHWYLDKKQVTGRLSYMVAGFVAPLLIMSTGPVFLMNWHDLIDRQNIVYSLVFASAGTCVALVFREIIINEK